MAILSWNKLSKTASDAYKKIHGQPAVSALGTMGTVTNRNVAPNDLAWAQATKEMYDQMRAKQSAFVSAQASVLFPVQTGFASVDSGYYSAESLADAVKRAEPPPPRRCMVWLTGAIRKKAAPVGKVTQHYSAADDEYYVIDSVGRRFNLNEIQWSGHYVRPPEERRWSGWSYAG